MAWQQLSFTLSQSDAGQLETFLEEFGALAITFSDAADQPMLEPRPGETPLWKSIHATVLFAEDVDLTPLCENLPDQFPTISNDMSVTALEDKEWLNEWKRDTAPKQYGERLWVYPWAAEDAADDDRVIVELEPGLAFGTGEHATTGMCLEWLESSDLNALSVMDYGCGSGLLAIAALKLGASHAFAVDIDEQAVVATQNNAAQNGVSGQLTVRNASAPVDERFDVVVANILSGILIDLSSTLTGMVADSGWLVVTGILEEQASDVQAAYAPKIALAVVAERDGWVLMAGQMTAE